MTTTTPTTPSEMPTNSILEEASAAAASPHARLLFPVALTIAAILPVAIGVGTASLKAASSSANVSSPQEVRESTSAIHEQDAEPRRVGRHLGDDLFRAGQIEAALHYYRSLGNADSLRLPKELSYRIAVCQEGLGLWDEALASYRFVATSTESQTLTAAATFGQARIWIRLGQPDQAAPLLRSLMLRCGERNTMPREVARELTFLVPLVLANELTSHNAAGSSCALVPVEDSLDWPLEFALDWLDSAKHHEDSPADASEVTGRPAIRARCVPIHGEDTASTRLEDRLVEVASFDQPLEVVLERLAAECGMCLDWMDDSRERASRRTTEVVVEDVPACSLLAAVCGELGLTWAADDQTLTIARADKHQEFSRAMAARTLESLVAAVPQHRLAGHARFALGRLAQAESRVADAARLYSSLVGKSSSPLAIRAAYNAGMSYYQLGDLSHACEQLEFVVHGAPGHELHTRSTLLLGRMLLDRGESREAAFQFQRAAGSRSQPEERARAAVYLAMAHLMQEKSREAAEALFAHKSHFEDPSVRNAAAFLTTLARHHMLTGAQQEREAAFLYRSLVAIESDSEWLGPTGQLLIGRALRELGFGEQMVELYSRALDKNPPNGIACEMKYVLAEQHRANDRISEAKAIWLELSDDGSSVWQNKARLRLAALALAEGRSSECVDACRSLSRADGVPRADLLKMMGRAYEQSGNDTLAAQCYSGQMPLP